MQTCELCGWNTRSGTRVCLSCRRTRATGGQAPDAAPDDAQLLSTVLKSARKDRSGNGREGTTGSPVVGVTAPPSELSPPGPGSARQRPEDHVVLREIDPERRGDRPSPVPSERPMAPSVAASLVAVLTHPTGSTDTADPSTDVADRTPPADNDDHNRPAADAEDLTPAADTDDDNGPTTVTDDVAADTDEDDNRPATDAGHTTPPTDSDDPTAVTDDDLTVAADTDDLTPAADTDDSDRATAGADPEAGETLDEGASPGPDSDAEDAGDASSDATTDDTEPSPDEPDDVTAERQLAPSNGTETVGDAVRADDTDAPTEAATADAPAEAPPSGSVAPSRPASAAGASDDGGDDTEAKTVRERLRAGFDDVGAWTAVAQLGLLLVTLLCVFMVVVLLVVRWFLTQAQTQAAAADLLVAHGRAVNIMLPALVCAALVAVAFAAWHARQGDRATPTPSRQWLGLPLRLWSVIVAAIAVLAVVVLDTSTTVAQAGQATLWAISACVLLGATALLAPRSIDVTRGDAPTDQGAAGTGAMEAV